MDSEIIKSQMDLLHHDAYATERELSKVDDRDWDARERDIVERFLLRAAFKCSLIQEALK